MKKFTTVILAITFTLTAVYAYNPPVGAEDMCLLSSPRSLSGGSTVAGGPLFNASSESIVINPALTAKEQRTSLNAAYTFLYSSNSLNEKCVGSAFQTGILIPTKLFVFSGYFNGTFIPYEEMHLGDSINLKAGLAKEITDKLSVGASVSGGYIWNYGTDWSLAGNVGFYIKQGDLGPFKDFRYGASILNIGKNYEDVLRVCADKSKKLTAFPTFFTVKAGAAASIVKTDVLDWGMALDITTPGFQNLLIDFSSQLSVKEMFFVTVGERFNFVESINNHYSLIPTIGVSFKFNFDVKDNSYLESNGWSQSEMNVSAAYRNLYKTANAISAGVDINLGLKDTEAPEIQLW